MTLSQVDLEASPPHISIPKRYNAALELLARNAAWPDKAAYVDSATGQTLRYGELNAQAHRFAHALIDQGFEPEQRVLLCMLDTLAWPVAFLGSILAGVVPIAVNTLLTTQDFDYMLRDSRAKGLLVSDALLPSFQPLLGQISTLKTVIVAGGEGSHPHLNFAKLVAQAADTAIVPTTQSDDACFWLYSSGSTGSPKGTVHLHSHLIQTAVLYGQKILGLKHEDVVYSAAKLFFAYGLGNALTFPMSVGATTVLLPSRPTPNDVFALLKKYQPTVFYGVPTLFASLLADPQRPARADLNLRVCTSAGEALPAEIGKNWSAAYGCEILDGIGSTEMLHIFLSNRPGQVRYGTTGWPVPGYDIELRGDDGQAVPDGEPGDLYIHGPSAALMYWGNRAKTRAKGAEVVKGARNSTPCAAHNASTPRMRDRLAFIRDRRRAPWAAMLTWSSWLAEVGVLSVTVGCAKCLFSLIKAAVVTSAIIRPEFRPGSGVRKGGRPKFNAGSTSVAMRRSEMAPISESASAT